ncbi:OmpA family protein [Lutimaribacter sp. EGI FJ00015]|uniref:OmpA family protein n=2 Tax=Lutimaribacter degradans TaxID=2945989 RepID=A0ACC5ZUR3_9RHOB|nr:OmpA family protein [Lutimaribacter sp. EGI FJ00013]MCM2561822.1 OmpA family protein [Lutimaribacter sp. EGI FJ00013]MCO0613145.1 OmpA family protein [Lutimaribacter sp. EGI FJ00015]MCO0635655.1 OmpA family protein [Lutimaribacter sp. EGI FJ00014]
MLRAILALLLSVAPAAALELGLPSNARVTAETVSSLDSYRLPTGRYDAGNLPARVIEGRVERRAWRIDGQGLTTMQILGPLRTQLEYAGYDILFECADTVCGGFDFRFEIEVLPAPAMYISLSDFRFLSARKDAQDHITLLVSRTGNAGYVQLVRVTGEAAENVPGVSVSDKPDGNLDGGATGVAQLLVAQGYAVLSDLDFGTGSSELSEGSYASLSALAAFMQDNPQARIALVGHTDAVGALDGNIALSRRRAASVLERLAESYDVPRERMAAEGMGYLSPVAPNTTAAGREANRRVEVVLLNTE